MEQLPFIIPFNLRVQTFRKFIEKEKETEGLNREDAPSQHVIIKRSRLGPVYPFPTSTEYNSHISVLLYSYHRILRVLSVNPFTVEDGFSMLAPFTGRELRQTIRVKFYNDLGLAEAGIDQDGVFKEFLEEINKRIFDPQCNLFKMTDDNKLYPSHTALVNPDSLDLFQFIGKMLGKAVYEGIVLDVHFARFFIR